MSKIAIIGSGIAGLTAAYLLNKKHDVYLYEQNQYFGGHTNTISVQENPKSSVNIDTGFIVFNSKNYPLFLALLNSLKVPYFLSDMSFAYYDPKRSLAYCGGRGLFSLFGQLKNIFNIAHLRFLLNIRKYSRKMVKDQKTGLTKNKTLFEYCSEFKVPQQVLNDYFIPIGSAIWSSQIHDIKQFPVDAYITFFQNHGLLFEESPPTWYSIDGGAQRYVEKIINLLGNNAHLSSKVNSVVRFTDHVEIELDNGNKYDYDKVVIATHANQAINLLEEPTKLEQKLLSVWEYSENDTILHSYDKFMPQNNRLWGSWNFLKRDNDSSIVTYNMNRLQSLKSNTKYLVTLNSDIEIPEKYIHYKTKYTHPRYTQESMSTQEQLPLLNGVNNTYFCGSYFGYGFHEDAVKSAVNIVTEIDGSYEF